MSDKKTSDKNKKKFYNFLTGNIYVDSGTIFVGDSSFFEKINSENYAVENNKTFEQMGSTQNIKPGKYKINIKIEETWNGPNNYDFVLEINSGKIVVCDPCYVLEDSAYDKILDETDYFRKVNRKYKNVRCLDEMGGDGAYILEISMEEII